MAKITIDIESIKESLTDIGYIISDFIPREEKWGTNWQLKFSNSGAIVNIYDTNTKNNSVVNGKCDDEEKSVLKNIVDSLKCKELTIDPINHKIVDLINSNMESECHDFKQEWCSSGKDGDFLHDILCLANNIGNNDAFLIVGVTDNYEVIGVNEWKKSNEIYDFLKSKKFAGEHMPEIELKKVYYKYKKIDVLEIKRNNNVPFFLEEKYKDVGTQIYTRVGDTNTAKNCSARYQDIEKLWEMHFQNK